MAFDTRVIRQLHDKEVWSEENFYKPHHYETVEVKDSIGRIIVRPGLQVPKDYTIRYYDSGLDAQVSTTNIVKEYSNYEYEIDIQDNNRNIFVIKREYIGVVLDDIERIMPYKQGSTQYRVTTLYKVTTSDCIHKKVIGVKKYPRKIFPGK